jgi:7-cyano-7-deazaguanine synthase
VAASTTAILTSGGLDSAVLLASEAQTRAVQPIYVSSGLAWETAELACLKEFLKIVRAPHAVLPLAHVSLPMTDIYPASHWALRGVPPDYKSADSEVYLIGRNITLLAKAAVVCAKHQIERIAVGQLRGNPFPDATPEFFSTFARGLGLGLGQPFEIVHPFLSLSKVDVIRRGAALHVPFEWTVSCMSPVGATHCGNCNKCRERKEAFVSSGLADPTIYRTDHHAPGARPTS